MRPVPLLTALACVLSVPSGPTAWADGATPRLTVSGFGQVTIYAPPTVPTQVVLFISGDGGWTNGVIPMAEALRNRGALVAGIDVRTLVHSLETAGTCAYPAGELERLSRTVQLSAGLASYRTPILAGYSSGATLAYAALATAPPETFAGAISLGFCPDLHIRRAPCQQNGLVVTRRLNGPGFDLHPTPRMQKPWIVLQGTIDQVCRPATTRPFVAAVPGARMNLLRGVGHGFGVPRRWQASYVSAYDRIATDNDLRSARAAAAASQATDVRDLSLVEVPGVTSAMPAKPDTMAVILTGDGGWADLDRQVAAALARRGVPSVGWSSLRYYWTPRHPDRAAADLARIITHYRREWGASRVRLVGYSFGADVLPFLVTRLPPDVRAHVASVALLGLSASAAFEFHVSDWISSRTAPYQTVPEVERLQLPVLCVKGSDERDSACRSLHGPRVTVADIGRGHHFGGDYERLAGAIAASDSSSRSPGIHDPSNAANSGP